MHGLARLLLLERNAYAETRRKYLAEKRKLSARPDAVIHDKNETKPRSKGDSKVTSADVEFVEMNNYDAKSLRIPYGIGWDARRIERMIYQTVSGYIAFFLIFEPGIYTGCLQDLHVNCQ